MLDTSLSDAAQTPENGTTVDALLDTADQALYAAKDARRDHIVLASELIVNS